jgi:hypothetical protein
MDLTVKNSWTSLYSWPSVTDQWRRTMKPKGLSNRYLSSRVCLGSLVFYVYMSDDSLPAYMINERCFISLCVPALSLSLRPLR